MRAIVVDPRLEVQQNHPDPVPGPGEALIKVHQAGICSTDLHIVRGYMSFAGILGHEFVGEVIEANGRADLIGTRVAGEINASCGRCRTCLAGRRTHCPTRTTMGISGRDGAFADYVCLPAENLHVLPDVIPDDLAVFVEPLAAACEILEQVHITPTDQIVVIGDGKLGLLCCQVLCLAGGAVTLLGRHSHRRDWVRSLGIHYITDVQQVQPGADVVIDATGSPEGLALAAEFVRPRGTIVLKSTFAGAVPVPMASLVVNEIRLIGSRCGPFPPAIRFLAQGLITVDPFIQERYPLDQGLTAFEQAAKPGALKILLEVR